MENNTDLRFLNRKTELEKTFQGNTCGNTKCQTICTEVMSAARAMRLDEVHAVRKAIQEHIQPECHCIPVSAAGTSEQYSGITCRFGFIPAHADAFSFSSKGQRRPPELKLKQFKAHSSACKKCQELNGKIVNDQEEKYSDKMQKKGFYRQKDGTYKPHPHCKCKWEKIRGKELSFVCDGLGIGRLALPFAQRFDGLSDLFDKIKSKNLPDNSVTHLRITAHGIAGGNAFPVSSPDNPTVTYFSDILSNAPKSKEYLNELKRIMSPMGVIELQMCEGVKGENGKQTAQRLANATGCIVKAYITDVNAAGTKSWKLKRPEGLKNWIDSEYIFTYPSIVPASPMYFFPEKP